MTLLFIYGPPAAGKTTIGGEVAKLTGFKFFFNHLTVPAAKAIFPDTAEPHHDERYIALLKKLRIDGLTAAAEAGFDTIFTMAYSGAVDDEFVASIVNIFESRGGRVCFVELHASAETLLQRVTNSSRTELHLGKMTNPEHLRQALATRDMLATVPYSDVLKINTQERSVVDATQQIITHFGLDQGDGLSFKR